MVPQVSSRNGLALVAACGCVLVLGCGESRDLDDLGVPRPPDAGVWYLDEMQKNAKDDEGAAGSAGGGAGSAGSDSTETGSTAGSGGTGAGTSGRGAGSATGGSGGRGAGSGTSGSGGSGAGSVPLPTGGSGGGFQFPGGGGQGAAPPPPPSEDVSSCSPCESISGSLGGVPACCTDDDQCGADLSALNGSAGCVARDQPGSPSDQCPSISIMNGGFEIPGCCRPNGRCGITIMRLAPLGCVAPDVVEDLLSFDSPAGRPGDCTP